MHPITSDVAIEREPSSGRRNSSKSSRRREVRFDRIEFDSVVIDVHEGRSVSESPFEAQAEVFAGSDLERAAASGCQLTKRFVKHRKKKSLNR